MRGRAQIFAAAKFSTPYCPDGGRSKPKDPQVLRIEPMTDYTRASHQWHLNDADLELSRMAVTDADLQALRVTDEDLTGMAPSAEEVLAMTHADWVKLGLARSVLTLLRADLMRRFGLSAQELTWLSRTKERAEDGHTRAQAGAD